MITYSTHEIMALDFHYHYSTDELMKDWTSLLYTSEYPSIVNFTPGIKLCKHFFPNIFDVTSGKEQLSFSKIWKTDYERMDKVREFAIRRWHGRNKPLDWIRSLVFMYCPISYVSFYRPHFAKQIISITGTTTGTLFDPCAGWGGRLLGTVASGWNYIGCEPNKETFHNLNRLIAFLGIKENVTLHNIPVEEFDFSSLDKVDVVLTSPPYFNKEQYSQDKTQSYIKYSDFDLWKNEWLLPLVQSCLELNPIISTWNVMDFDRYTIKDDIHKVHNRNEFYLFQELGYKSPRQQIARHNCKSKNSDNTILFKRTNNLSWVNETCSINQFFIT